MINESCYSKDDLLKQAKALRRWKPRRHLSEPSIAAVERIVMIGFYAIRKLKESAKLSDATFTKRVPLTAFRWTGRPVTLSSCHKIDQLYDLASPITETRDLIFLCHQFIHSYIFLPLLTETGSLGAVLFTSDRQRHERLYSIELARIVALFECVGHDYPSSVRMVFNPGTGDFDVTAGHAIRL